MRPKFFGKPPIDAFDQPGDDVRGRRQDHAVEIERLARRLGELHPPTRAAALDPHDGRVQMHRTLRQPGGQGIDEAGKPVAQRDEHAVAGAAFALALGAVLHLPPHRADQAAVFPLHFAKTRQGGLDAELLHVGRIDRAHQRFDEPIERLAPEAAADELRHALVAVAHPRGKEVFQGRAELAQRAQQRRDGQRPHLRRRHHEETVGEAIKPPAANHKRPPIGRIRLHELAGQPQPRQRFTAQGIVVMKLSALRSTSKPSRRTVERTPPSRGPASSSVRRTWGSSSIKRWAAARPAMPPPKTATCRAVTCESLTLLNWLRAEWFTLPKPHILPQPRESC